MKHVLCRALNIHDKSIRCPLAVQHQILDWVCMKTYRQDTFAFYVFSVWSCEVDALITILTSILYSWGKEEAMFLKFIFLSSLGDAVKSHDDLFLFLKTYPRIMPHFKKSLQVLIHILYMIGPSILRVSEGRFDSFMVWRVCLPYCFSFTMVCNTTVCVVLWQTDGSEYNKYWMLVPVSIGGYDKNCCPGHWWLKKLCSHCGSPCTVIRTWFCLELLLLSKTITKNVKGGFKNLFRIINARTFTDWFIAGKTNSTCLIQDMWNIRWIFHNFPHQCLILMNFQVHPTLLAC